MKKFTLIFILTILFSSSLLAQKDSYLEKANRYLKEKGEVIFTFKATSKAQFLELNEFLSISHKHVDEQLLEVEAYANKDQFKKFLAYGLSYKVTKEDNEIAQEDMSNYNRAANAWDTTWDAYPKYSEYVAKMQYWATTYPSLCTLQSIGTTPNGRNLYILKISDNASTDEKEPEFLYTSSMHGDEITGYPTMLHFIDYLLTNYGTLAEITNLVNGTELYICPLANPDGSYKTAGNDVMNSTGNTATRANAAGVDMNRNYPDYIGGIHPDGLAFQSETLSFLNFERTRNFVLAANYHGGAEVVNFPWDTSTSATGASATNVHPQDAYFRYASQEYAQLCQTADGNLNYMDDVYGTGQFAGTTNGAIWYTVKGGRQDNNNYFNHNKEVTIEISVTKFPAASNLLFHWDRNRQALLNFVKQASYGLQGVVTDANGNPIHAKVYVSGTSDGFGAWVETSPTNGDYHKVQIAGTYNVIFEAPGYATQTISATLTNGAATTLNVTMVPTTATPTASDATICQGQTAALTATGTGTIKWYNSVTSTSILASTASYTTPALNTTTSYWVESEVTPPNVGPTTVSGTVSNNTAVANRYLIFNCTSPTKLKTVLITPSATGQILVELQNSAGVMLESKVVFITSTGTQDIDLDFFLPVATGLRLVSREVSGLSLTCAISGITYPITSGNISITSNSGTGTFLPFFNWKLAPIKSIRDEVIVTVKPNPIESSVSPTSKIAGAAGFNLTVTGSNFVNGDAIVRWNGTNRTTTFVSSTELTATISAADVATAGTANVTVFSTCNSFTTAAQTFTINSNCTAPVANIASLPTITGQCNATVTAPTATSNCYGTITATTASPLTYSTQGTFNITWTYNDGNGLTSTQTQQVILNDTTAPVANVTNLPTITGQCNATVTAPTATDNCSGTITATTASPLTYATQGTFNITWTYTDAKGNTSTQTQTVIVSDGGQVITFYQDLDGDTFGNPLVSTQSCTQPIGYVTNNTDCNDSQIQYADLDADGFGSTTQVACGVTNNTDCNDNNASANVLITFYQDLDCDTFGNPLVSTQSCTQPIGYVTNNTDCNDTNSALNALNTYYKDLDGDGYGNPSMSVSSCTQPVGYVGFGTDCDDANANVHPGAIDVCYDGLDNDCNGIIDNSCTPIVSSLATASCGSTLVGWYNVINATPINTAQGYRFKITKIDKITNLPLAAAVINDRPVNNLSLANVVGTTYDTKYQVEIAVKYNNVWQPFYGPACYVNTPNPVSTIGSQCGTTLSAFNQWITATVIPNISLYRFRVTQLDASLQPVGTAQVTTQSLNKFNLTQLTGILYGTTYRVEVALRNIDGTFLEYNAPCNITSPAYPTTQLKESQCNNYTVASTSELIYADYVANAVVYRFRLFNGAGYDATFDTASNRFTLNNFTGLVAGSTYSVQVSVKISNQLNFGPFGQICTILKPGISARTLEENTNQELNISIYPNPFSDSFSIKSENLIKDKISISVYDLTGRIIETKMIDANDLETTSIGSSYPSGVYSMIISNGEMVKTIRIIKR